MTIRIAPDAERPRPLLVHGYLRREVGCYEVRSLEYVRARRWRHLREGDARRRAAARFAARQRRRPLVAALVAFAASVAAVVLFALLAGCTGKVPISKVPAAEMRFCARAEVRGEVAEVCAETAELCMRAVAGAQRFGGAVGIQRVTPCEVRR